MDLISLDNFDPDATEPPYLTSPRSLEACRRTGIDPMELLRKPREDYLKGKVTKVDRDVAVQTYMHDEKIREEKMQVVRDARGKVIEERKNAQVSTSSQTDRPKLDSSLIEREKKDLERLQRKQELEIQQMVEFEKKQAQIRMRNQEKDQQLKQKELVRLRELVRKQKELAEAKQKEEERRKRILVEEENRVKKLEMEEAARSRKRQQEEEMKEKQRIRDTKAKEKARELKSAELKANTAKMIRDQQLRFEYQRKLMQSREEKRVKMMLDAQKKRSQESEQVKGIKEKKIATARANLARLNESQRVRFEERQRQNEKKREMMEKGKRKMMEELRKKGAEKQKQIQDVARMNKQKEEHRYQIYQESVSKAEKLQIELERQKSVSLRKKLLREQEKAHHIQIVRDRMHAIELDRISKIIQVQTEKETAISKARGMKEYQDTLRRNEKELKRRDKFQAVQRMGKVQAYEKLQVLRKMEKDDKRAKEIQ